MVIFRHPGGASARLDRYNWFISNGPEARSVTSRLPKTKVLEALTDADLVAPLSTVDENLASGSAVCRSRVERLRASFTAERRGRKKRRETNRFLGASLRLRLCGTFSLPR